MHGDLMKKNPYGDIIDIKLLPDPNKTKLGTIYRDDKGFYYILLKNYNNEIEWFYYKQINMINDEEYIYQVTGNNLTDYLVRVTDDMVVVYTHDENNKEKDEEYDSFLKLSDDIGELYRKKNILDATEPLKNIRF
jgi:hypothetical protein